ncbi:MAG: AzlD domain-containing protein [Coriobacteriia bacterium]
MRPYYVVLILCMAAVTYATRVGFIGVARQFELHPLLRRSLEYVPVSILAALVFPAVLAPSGRMEQPLTNTYVWAAVITVVVLLTTKRQWLAIVLGVASLVVLRRVTGA